MRCERNGLTRRAVQPEVPFDACASGDPAASITRTSTVGRLLECGNAVGSVGAVSDADPGARDFAKQPSATLYRNADSEDGFSLCLNVDRFCRESLESRRGLPRKYPRSERVDRHFNQSV